VLAGVEHLVEFLAAVGADPDALEVFGRPVGKQHLQQHPGFLPQMLVLGILMEAGETQQVEVVIIRGIVFIHAPGDVGVDPALDPGGGLPLRLRRCRAVGQPLAVRPGLSKEVAGGAELQHVVVGETEVRRETRREASADLFHQRRRELRSQPQHGIHERIGLEAAPRGLRGGDGVLQVAETGCGIDARGELHHPQVDPSARI